MPRWGLLRGRNAESSPWGKRSHLEALLRDQETSPGQAVQFLGVMDRAEAPPSPCPASFRGSSMTGHSKRWIQMVLMFLLEMRARLQ